MNSPSFKYAFQALKQNALTFEAKRFDVLKKTLMFVFVLDSSRSQSQVLKWTCVVLSVMEKVAQLVSKAVGLNFAHAV